MFTNIDSKPLEEISNTRDILRDLFVYLDYARQHSIKRMTRTNAIPRSDLVRLAKLLDLEPPEKDDWMVARPYWITFLDRLALRMNLVSYDVKGEYRGYSSADTSFIDNYVVINEAQLYKFFELTPVEQEKGILDALNRAKSNHSYDDASFNEFFHYGPFGFLDTFDGWGSGTGIMPLLNFPEIRLFLLGILKICPTGQWLSTQSLIAYLKANHPHFLIPDTISKTDRWGKPMGRYDNFHEGSQYEARDKMIPVDAPDAFERVEGRYVERFLEYIPFTMSLVDLAYSREQTKGIIPSLGYLKAMRINERFVSLMGGESVLPKVTIQPNFDVIIESNFYPARVLSQVATLGERMSNNNSGHGAYVGIFQLKKTAVAATLAKQPDLDIPAMLKKLSGRDLPPNVQIELEEWADHADQFTLYEGFSLLETNDLPVEVEKFRSEKISPSLNLVRSPDKVFLILENRQQIPLWARHFEHDFALLPEDATSLFPREIPETNDPKVARPVKINKVVTISYKFPAKESFDAFRKTLAELRCPFLVEIENNIIRIQTRDQGKFDEAVKQLEDDFIFEIE